MNINIKLDKNFVTQYNRMQSDYGTEIAAINGFSDTQLSYTDFIDNFVDTDTVADSSIDGNSNVSHKDMVTLLNEMPKPHRKLLAFNKIFYEMQKRYGFRVANEWLKSEWIGELYMHDADTSTFKHYCFAYDLKDLAEKGLYFVEGQNPAPAKHLITFVDFVKEFISFASNRSSGAVGLPNLIPYMYYFWRQDVQHDYLGIKTAHRETEYARQNFQRFLYAVNQPYVRDGSQSAFTNTSVFDKPYFEALFGGSTFPDGSFMIDFEDEMIEFQKLYMEVMSEIRSQNMFTFPVSTISLLRKDGEFVDEGFARWAIHHNMKWSDSNLFVDDSVNSLSNCPLAPDTKIDYWEREDGVKKTERIDDLYSHYAGNKKEYFFVRSNERLVRCKVNRFEIPVEYKITLHNGAELMTTANHLNKVHGKPYVESKDLTLNDFLPFEEVDHWVRIKSIERLDGSIKESYCLEILDAEAEPIFTLANGIITHNCRLKSNIEDLGYVKMPYHPFTAYQRGQRKAG